VTRAAASEFRFGPADGSAGKARLVDAESGHQFWAKRYDRPTEDIGREASSNLGGSAMICVIGLISDVLFASLNRRIYPWAHLGR
jgi:hypothetical protein